MKRFLKGTILAAAVSSVGPLAAPASHAFDLADYMGTYRQALDAYRKAQREFAYAEAKMSFVMGVMALYGESEYADAFPEVSDIPKEPWCRYHDFKQSDRGAAFPEVRGYVNEFADGHSTHALLQYPAQLHGGKTKSADLHFLTAGGDDSAAVMLQDFVTAWPFADAGQKAEVMGQLANDLAAADQGIEPWMPTLADDPDARNRLTPQYWFAYYFGDGPGLPNDWGWDSRFPLGVPNTYYGETCATDADCPTGVHCEEGSWWWGYASFPTTRCHYVDQAVVFPPTPFPKSDNYLAVLGKAYGDYQWHNAANGIPDFEDWHTDYRAARDAYLKAANELKLATGPYKAARDAFVKAMTVYLGSVAAFFQ